MKYFEDTLTHILIQDGSRKVAIPRELFLSFEPSYSLGHEYIGRIYRNGAYSVISAEGQTLATDIDEKIILEFISKSKFYKDQLGEVEETEDNFSENNFSALETALRGSKAWSTMFTAMSKSLRANTAGSLIMVALSATRNVYDLRAGFSELLASMHEQTSVPKFSEEEISEIKNALEISGFDVSLFF